MTSSMQPTQEELRGAMRQVLLLEQLQDGMITEAQRLQLARLQEMLLALEADTDNLAVAMQRVAAKREQLTSLDTARDREWVESAPLTSRQEADNAEGVLSIHDVPDNTVLFGVAETVTHDDDVNGSDSSSSPRGSESESTVGSTSGRTPLSGHRNTTPKQSNRSGGHGVTSAVSDTSSVTTTVETVLGIDGLEGSSSPRPPLASPSPSEGGSFSGLRSPMGKATFVVNADDAKGSDALPQVGSSSTSKSPQPALLEHAPWQPPAVAIGADAPLDDAGTGDAPVRHKLILHTRTVMRKPKGFEEKDKCMQEQGLYCKGCLAPLKASFSAMRLGKSWDAAKFCYYTGYYYCADCHPCRETSVIPARILNYWDFTPLSVSSDAKNFLELNHDSPMLCLSAVNPKLYELLPVLRAARSLRIQLNILVDIGSKCRGFRAEFFGERPPRGKDNSLDNITATGDDSMRRNRDYRRGSGSASRSSPPRGSQLLSASSGGGHERDRESQHRGPSREEVAYVIPACKRYLVQDSEFWSLADLLDIKSTEDKVQQMDHEEMRRVRDAMGTVDAQGKLNTSASMFRANSATKFSTAPTAGGFHRTVSASGTGAGGDAAQGSLADCELTKFLKQTRGNMVRHVVQLCRQGPDCCFRHAAQLCPLCKKKDFIYIFDLNRTRTCTRCGSCYHRDCWQRRKGHHTACVVCVSSMVSNAEQSPRTAAAAMDDAS